MNKRRWLRSIWTLLLGLCVGVSSRWLDLHTQILGNIFSELAIWILLGTLLAIYSPTPKRAMANVLPFCLGMLVTYYGMAMVTDGVFHRTIILGWTVFALCSPVFAYLAWYSKECGWFSKLIGVGIVTVSFGSSLILFGGPHFYDWIIDGFLMYLLFVKRIRR